MLSSLLLTYAGLLIGLAFVRFAAVGCRLWRRDHWISLPVPSLGFFFF